MIYKQAMKHKATISSMAAEALAEGKSTQVAVKYDEEVRRESMLAS